MRVIFYLLLFCCFLLSIPPGSFAETYKYRDANGRLSFVDDPSKIPPQFRTSSTAITESEDSIDVYDTPEPEYRSPENALQQGAVTTVKPRPEKHQTAVEIRGNRILVPVQVAVGGSVEKLSLLLDTGATTTVFHRKSLGKLNLPSGKSYNARVAGGGIVKSEKIRFQYIKVGPFKIKQADAMVINLKGQELSFDGMLGMDFLKEHPYQVDFTNNLITWQTID